MSNPTKWLTVIGIEEGGAELLSPLALLRIAAADVLIGGKRHLAMIENETCERWSWKSPFASSIDDIEAVRGKRVVILASGDPLWFGVGNKIARRFSDKEIEIIPARSVFSLAAAHLHWSLADCECITLHGRPLGRMERGLYPGSRMILLSRDGTTPAMVAKMLLERGFGDSLITVLEHLGGEQENVRTAIAADFDLQNIADLNCVAVECEAGNNAQWQGRAVGLPDDAFAHDGQITKQMVRAITLAKLKPFPSGHLWDVGAGCGSIAVEWMRAGHYASADAIESKPERLAFISENKTRFGLAHLNVVEGSAPEALSGLPIPDAIFIGGGFASPGVFDICLNALKPGGRMVVNVVTLESQAQMIALQKIHGGELARIAIEQAAPLGNFQSWKPAMPVVQWVLNKPGKIT